MSLVAELERKVAVDEEDDVPSEVIETVALVRLGNDEDDLVWLGVDEGDDPGDAEIVAE